MTVHGIDCPVQEGFIIGFYADLSGAFNCGIVYPMVIVETDILVGKQFIHVVI